MPPLPLPLARRSVVVIEDRPPGRRAYADALRDAGAFVMATDQATAAGEPVPGLSPADAVVLVADHADPHDWAAARSLRDRGFRGLILVLVGDWSSDASNEWARYGADDCLPKPADPAELPARLADYLLRWSNAALPSTSSMGTVNAPLSARREAAASQR